MKRCGWEKMVEGKKTEDARGSRLEWSRMQANQRPGPAISHVDFFKISQRTQHQQYSVESPGSTWNKLACIQPRLFIDFPKMLAL